MKKSLALSFVATIIGAIISFNVEAAIFALECSSRDDGLAQATLVEINSKQATITFHYSENIVRIDLIKSDELPSIYVYKVVKANDSTWDNKEHVWLLARDTLVLQGTYMGALPFRCNKLSNPDAVNKKMDQLYYEFSQKQKKQEQNNIQNQLKQNKI